MEDQQCGLHLWLILFLHACVLGVYGIRFDLTASETKCIADELSYDSLVVANYRVVTENAPKISVKVTSPYGKTMHFSEHVYTGEFAFTATEAGNYMACFWMPSSTPGTTISVEADWKTGVAAKDWTNIAKREKIDGIELELRKLEDFVGTIHDEMMHLRDREAEMRNLNEVTNSRLAWFTVTSLFICLLIAGLQLWHLKTFFERKKLL